MQRRMEAGFRKYDPECPAVINFASYRAAVEASGEGLRFSEPIHGMWSMDRYVHLLMGEIPRLRDDEAGYGPKGKGFIAHVDIPGEVCGAFEFLKTVYGAETTAADPSYASGKQPG